MSDMVRAWLDHTQQLDQDATPAPWEADGKGILAEREAWDVGRGPARIAGMEMPYRTERMEANAEWIAYARQALPAATKALRAVLDLHEPIHALDYGQPVRGKRLTHVCTGCGQDDGNWNYWPCPTVKAITDALTSHQHPTQGGE